MRRPPSKSIAGTVGIRRTVVGTLAALLAFGGGIAGATSGGASPVHAHPARHAAIEDTCSTGPTWGGMRTNC